MKMKTKANICILAVILLMINLTGCSNDEAEGTWYLVENDNFKASLELNGGKASFYNSAEYDKIEFNYIFEEGMLELTSEEVVLYLTVREDKTYGKVLMKDDEIYACQQNESANQIIAEKEAAIGKEKQANVSVVEKRVENVKAAIIGEWRADEMTSGIYGTFAFNEDGTYRLSHRDQYPSGRAPLEDKYIVSYDDSYTGEGDPDKIKIRIRLYDNESDRWIIFRYSAKQDVLICCDERYKGPYYRLVS